MEENNKGPGPEILQFQINREHEVFRASAGNVT